MVVVDFYRLDFIIDILVVVKKYGIKDVLIDGKDGRFYVGFFVEFDSVFEFFELFVLKDWLIDFIIIDGKKILDSNDGVMDDKNWLEFKKGIMGLEGGVSEKDKEWKFKE